jgi:hypothetical protein
MRKQDIEIVIDAKGQVTFEVKGVKGGSCVAETAFLEAALGGDKAVVAQGADGRVLRAIRGLRPDLGRRRQRRQRRLRPRPALARTEEGRAGAGGSTMTRP